MLASCSVLGMCYFLDGIYIVSSGESIRPCLQYGEIVPCHNIVCGHIFATIARTSKVVETQASSTSKLVDMLSEQLAEPS